MLLAVVKSKPVFQLNKNKTMKSMQLNWIIFIKLYLLKVSGFCWF